MDKLVTVGRNLDGSLRQVSARELTGHLHGHPRWIYPHQLKEKYSISDEMWPSVQADLYDDYRALHQEIRKNNHHVLNMNVNQRLLEYALALPHGANMSILHALDEALARGQQHEVERLIFVFVMEPTYRARLLATRYDKVKLFREFAYLIDASYFAYLRHNFAAAFMTILPVIEGIILRWATEREPSIYPAGRKIPYKKIREFVENTPRRTPLLAVPLFADIWAATCAAILKNSFYKETDTGPSVENFSRHLALHMIEDKEFCTPFNIARAFLLLDLICSLYLAENHQTDIADMSLPEDILPYSMPYFELIRGSKENNLERIMARYIKYKSMVEAHDQVGEPAVYWKNPLMLPLREIFQRAILFAGEKLRNS